MKVIILGSLFCFYVSISLICGHFLQMATSFIPDIGVDEISLTSTSWLGDTLNFFGGMMTFSIPNMPEIFNILWYLGLLVIVLIIVLIVRGID